MTDEKLADLRSLLLTGDVQGRVTVPVSTVHQELIRRQELSDHTRVTRTRGAVQGSSAKLVSEVEKAGVVAMVFGAWGCGSFGLQPQMVAKLFKQRLMRSSIPVAHFSIFDDHNGVGNYSAFRQILCSG